MGSPGRGQRRIAACRLAIRPRRRGTDAGHTVVLPATPSCSKSNRFRQDPPPPKLRCHDPQRPATRPPSPSTPSTATATPACRLACRGCGWRTRRSTPTRRWSWPGRPTPTTARWRSSRNWGCRLTPTKTCSTRTRCSTPPSRRWPAWSGRAPSLSPVLVVGAPLRLEAKLFNCAIVVHRGRVLGVVPKTLPAQLPRVLREAAVHLRDRPPSSARCGCRSWGQRRAVPSAAT